MSEVRTSLKQIEESGRSQSWIKRAKYVFMKTYHETNDIDKARNAALHVQELKTQSNNIKEWAIAIGVVLVLCVCGAILPESSEVEAGEQPPVYNSAWDGSVSQAKSLLQDILRDPDSVQYIKWFPVRQYESGNYFVAVTFRAKNGFGGYNRTSILNMTLDKDGNLIEYSLDE